MSDRSQEGSSHSLDAQSDRGKPESLVEARARLDKQVQDKIQELLAEDENNHRVTADRHVAILAELKLLGWKRPRAAKATTQEATQESTV